jgi:hypothetical protein
LAGIRTFTASAFFGSTSATFVCHTAVGWRASVFVVKKHFFILRRSQSWELLVVRLTIANAIVQGL